MKNKYLYLSIVSLIVIFGVVARIIPHFPNFAPMGAIALFAAIFYRKSSVAFLVPFAAWWLSDLYLNNFVYHFSDSFQWLSIDQLFSALAMLSIVLLSSKYLKNINLPKALAGGFAASLIFFVISNFGVWMQGYLYPMNFQGLVQCYVMALPFYKATLASDLLYTGVFFSAMYLINNKSFNLQLAPSSSN